MGKRILLFVLTNLAIVATLSIVLGLLGIGGYYTPTGIDYTALMLFCLVWGMGGAFISLLISRWIAKRAMGVQLIDGHSGRPEAWVYQTVQRLTQQAQLPMPEVGIYDSPEVNAFATGPSKSRSLVAVSTGLLTNMRREEIEGVLAHEVSHIQNGDMVTMTLIQGVVNAFVMFASRVIAGFVRNMVDERNAYLVTFIVTIVLDIAFGMLGLIIVAWFSRAREFRADAGAAALSGRNNMIAALRRLGQSHQLVDNRSEALATMKINGGDRRLMMLFSTHPPIAERIKALETLRAA
ncbi:MAG: protease HtpX [Acidobacteria bacterium]|nr:protease HtpX [Acidobacteriota bacterium]